MKKRIRPIAFYLPQFYPTPENDEWWGPGFTEWTNVASSKPLFKGHYQPRIPQELSFYDLRLPSVREKQAELAKLAGIEGFCYWHYWFAGRRLLDQVFREVVETGKPDFPFCLCWANHSWEAKTWKPGMTNTMLMEQTYPGEEDFINHFYAMLPAFKDKRYMRMEDGRLVFGIFAPDRFPDAKLFFDTWNQLAKENGLEGFYFFGLVQWSKKFNRFDNSIYDTIVFDALHEISFKYMNNWFTNKLRNLKVRHLNKPYITHYKEYVEKAPDIFRQYSDCTPCIDPDFDHSPRSAHRWVIVDGSTPSLYGKLCKDVKNVIESIPDSNRLLFIKAWNEWGEGNYLEPDTRWGRSYIEEMGKVFRT